MSRIFTLSDTPPHLMKRVGHEHHDRKNAVAMTRWIEMNLPYRPSLWEIHEERVRRGIEKVYDKDAALDAIRNRREDRKRQGQPRKPRRARSGGRGAAA